MSYEETVGYLYGRTPQFQSIGAAAYKPGLDTVKALAGAFGNPQGCYRVIHVAGTNGKGSTSHTLAAVLQAAGYKVGLYTSPHLIDFRERIRCNGEMISETGVVDFVERYRGMSELEGIDPSFFELTTVMAFDWFARERVDVAVIEVGLGGRLDSTNIVEPELSVITNVSFDHMAQLGDTLESIAHEKAGIMRAGVPVICGETDGELQKVFAREAREHGAPIRFSMDERLCSGMGVDNGMMLIRGTRFGDLQYQLTGDCQRQNARTVLSALDELSARGWHIDANAVRQGFARVCDATGLMGRWMKLSDRPLVICDTGHNIGGWELLSVQLQRLPRPLAVVLGFVNDKDIEPILPLLPGDASYVFTKASIPRAMDADKLAFAAGEHGLHGVVIPSVGAAYEYALVNVAKLSAGSVFVGGSTFVVADLLKHLKGNIGKKS